MQVDVIDAEEAIRLVERVDPKFRPVWTSRAAQVQAALAMYFLPHHPKKPIIGPTRPRVVKWYCPFAAQTEFPSGHRYCINVYTGCSHGCIYCYAAAYEPDKAAAKAGFERLIDKDMEDLERFDVPAAPVHLSNSTDAFQPLEERYGHTRYALERILARRKRFTTVTLLTKDPLRPVRLGYVGLFKELGRLPSGHSACAASGQNGYPAFVIAVSLAFWQDSSRAVYEPSAPAVENRIEGIRALRQEGIPVVVRIDPLFPRSPVTSQPLRSMRDIGLPEAQTLDDLENLVALAKEVRAHHTVYSTAKIVQPRGRKLCQPIRQMRAAYEVMAAPEKLVFRGGSWRLPNAIGQAHVVDPFLQICKCQGVLAKHCMRDLVDTP